MRQRPGPAHRAARSHHARSAATRSSLADYLGADVPIRGVSAFPPLAVTRSVTPAAIVPHPRTAGITVEEMS